MQGPTAMREGWRERLAEVSSVEFDSPLAPRVAFRIGGPADAFVKPTTAEELAQIVRLTREFDVPLTVLGTGSNVLISDSGIRGVTVRLAGELADCQIDEPVDGYARMLVGAGALNAPVVARALQANLCGIEFLATIPGTFGGALIMNAGAHGGEIGPFVQTVRLIDQDLQLVDRLRDDCGFAYRTSAFASKEILTGATLRVPVGDTVDARANLKHMREARKATQPIKEPNAGSIFKNPPGDYAGRMIEACGLKGRRFGNAGISSVHANFIVNHGGATAMEVKVLAAQAQAAVRDTFGVVLEWEVKQVGD